MNAEGKYNDRGMLKWRPFASMPEQYAGLDPLFYFFFEFLPRVE